MFSLVSTWSFWQCLRSVFFPVKHVTTVDFKVPTQSRRTIARFKASSSASIPSLEQNSTSACKTCTPFFFWTGLSSQHLPPPLWRTLPASWKAFPSLALPLHFQFYSSPASSDTKHPDMYLTMKCQIYFCPLRSQKMLWSFSIFTPLRNSCTATIKQLFLRDYHTPESQTKCTVLLTTSSCTDQAAIALTSK